MHVWPNDDEEMWYDGDLVYIAGPNTIKAWRIKERYLKPNQDRIDKYALDDEQDWCYHDESRMFCVLEVVGLAPNTDEGRAELAELGK